MSIVCPESCPRKKQQGQTIGLTLLGRSSSRQEQRLDRNMIVGVPSQGLPRISTLARLSN